MAKRGRKQRRKNKQNKKHKRNNNTPGQKRGNTGRPSASEVFQSRYPDFKPGNMLIKTSYGYVDPAQCEARFESWKMPLRPSTYVMRTPGKSRQIRAEFSDVKPLFLAHIAKHCYDELRSIGVTHSQIERMAEKGRSPPGFNIHHKKPIGGGGDNDFSNLCFIKVEPFHTEIHKHLDTQLIDMKRGEARKVMIAWPPGMVFVPQGYTPPSNKKKKRKGNTSKRDRQFKMRHYQDGETPGDFGM